MKKEARRTMSEALRAVELPAAAIAVIKEGALKPRAGTNALAVAAPSAPGHQYPTRVASPRGSRDSSCRRHPEVYVTASVPVAQLK